MPFKLFHYICAIKNIMSYITKLFLYVSSITMFACCGGHSERNILNDADNFLSAHKYDSAYHLLNRVDVFDLEDDDRAFYSLLMTQAMYALDMDNGSDSLIDFSIKYYKKDKDVERLVSSYYYKGVANYYRNNEKEAVLNLKKAEGMLSDLNDNELHFKILTYISRINFKSENYALALEYEKKSLHYAELLDNAKFTALIYNHLACTFEKLGMSDSAYFYVMKSIRLIDGAESPKSKAIMYANIADYYYQKGDMRSYGKYLSMSKSLYIIPGVLSRYALMKYKEGKHKEADSIWKKALGMSEGKEKTDIYETIINNLDEEDNHKALLNHHRSLNMLKDSLNKQRHTQQIHDIQLRYNNDIMKRRYGLILTRAITFSVIIFLLFIIVVLYSKVKQKQHKTKLLESQILIDSYNRQIEEYKKSKKDTKKKIKRLEEKLSSIYSEQTSTFTKGRSCYKHILENSPIVTWKKSDYVDFIEYYKLVDLPFVISIEREYKSLTPGNKLLLILQNMGKTEAELQKILGTTIGTIRVQQSRIRKKRIDSCGYLPSE